MTNRKKSPLDAPINADHLERETTQMSLINEDGKVRPSGGRNTVSKKKAGSTKQPGNRKGHQ